MVRVLTTSKIGAKTYTRLYGRVFVYGKIVVYDTTNRTDSTTHFFMG